MFRILTKLIIISIVTLLLQGCSGTRSFSTQRYLLDRVEVFENEKQLINSPVNYIITTLPNKKVIGIPLGKILYQAAHPSPEEQFEKWLNKKSKRKERLAYLLSNKQVEALKNYGVKFNTWLTNTGEVPAYVDSLEILNSERRIIQYYKNLGNFNAVVTSEITPITRNKAQIKYQIKPGEKFLIDSISTTIASKDIQSLYDQFVKEQIIKKNDPFEIQAFEAERERLFTIFKNNGIFNFQQSSINFTASIDSTGVDVKIPIRIEIDNPQERVGDTILEIPYAIQTVKQIDIFINDKSPFLSTELFSDTLAYNSFTLYSKGPLKFRPKTIIEGISIKKNQPYSDLDRNLTYRYFTNLKNFKYPTISFLPIEEDENALKASVILTPREQFSLGFDLDLSHSNIQDFGVGLGGGLGIRNVFRGTELLELNLKSTLGASRDIAQPGDQFFNLFELGADLKLSLPRIAFPFLDSNWISTIMNPKTEIILGSSLQENIGLDKQFFKTTYQFDWQPNTKKRIQLKVIDLEFVNNRKLSNYFNVYKNSYDRLNRIAQTYNNNKEWVDGQNNLTIPDGAFQFIEAVLSEKTILKSSDNDFKTVNTVKERQDRLTANNLILASSLNINWNNQESIFDENFYQLRGKLVWAGNLINKILDQFNSNQNLIGGIAPSQYVKAEMDYIKHWSLGKERVIAFHSFTGIAIPYGNSSNMPFSRSYFSGGANDNRAWKAYKLGPGSSNNINEFNEANFKIATNLEYRFPLVGPLKGSIFVDAGNIWNIWDDIEDPALKFDSLKDLEEIAIGTGIGLRYDFDFFVFRLDTGFKAYNPALALGKRWWQDFNLKNAVLNIGINYPF